MGRQSRFSISGQVFDIRPSLRHQQAKSSISDQVFDIRPSLRYQTKSSISDQVFDIRPSLRYQAKSSISGHVFDISPCLRYQPMAPQPRRRSAQGLFAFLLAFLAGPVEGLSQAFEAVSVARLRAFGGN